MKMKGIIPELLYTRGNLMAEASYALTVLALSGHTHSQLSVYRRSIKLGAFDDSEEEQQTTIAVLSNILRGRWQLSTSTDTIESGQYWYSEFRYEFE